MNFAAKALTVTVAAAVLAGCGGGGGGSTTATSGNVDSVTQSFGSEAPKAQLTQASATAEAYLGAVAAGQWDKACSSLASPLRSKFTSLGDKSPASKGKGCAGGIETLLSKAPKENLQSAVLAHALSLRAQGELGFLIFRNDAGKLYRLPMRREGGKWKVGSPFSAPLAP